MDYREEKQAKRAAYMRQYRIQNKGVMKRVSFSLPADEFAELETLAAKHGLSPAQYVRDVFRAYHNEERILPKDIWESYKELVAQVRGAARNINQLAHHANIQAKNRSKWFGQQGEVFSLEEARLAVLALQEPILQWLKKAGSKNGKRKS